MRLLEFNLNQLNLNQLRFNLHFPIFLLGMYIENCYLIAKN
ncbi:hypothetical protein HMPREF1576_00739 [Gardnerella pickettii JCP7719]|uniref:Uncharacterized protein n=1 Tax=Gardnerella pickettii JCP7719 TaxID=1261061 RepID=S4GXS8_9BIFI|nr:hypothetical protein HMPREF1576_00739 [Gardnerella pickettii JCP7719]